MSVVPPPPPSSTAVFCGRCGASVSPGVGFCGRCGNPVVPVAAAATGYSYPMAAASTVPAMRHKVSHARLWLITGAVIAIVAVVVTVIAVAARPTSQPCGYYCGPHSGGPLVSQSVYTNKPFNLSIEYSAARLKVIQQSDTGVAFVPLRGDGSAASGELYFAFSKGTNTDGALADAVAALPTATIQNMQEVGSVRGAEIGLILGTGTAYTANLVPADGGPSQEIAVIVMAATSNNVTITATMFSPYSKDISDAPYGLAYGNRYDYPITNTHWPGG